MLIVKEDVLIKLKGEGNGMLESKTCSGECVVIETPLPCSPSFESESGGKKRETDKRQEMCGGGAEKEKKVECQAKLGGSARHNRENLHEIMIIVATRWCSMKRREAVYRIILPLIFISSFENHISLYKFKSGHNPTNLCKF